MLCQTVVLVALLLRQHCIRVHFINKGHAVAQLVEALRYKPEGRGFDAQ